MTDLEVTMEFDAQAITRIRKYWKTLPKKINKEVRKSVAEEARLILRRSQELVPVRTGLLKRSKFLRRSSTTGTKSTIRFGYKVKEAKRNVKRVYDYAPVVEYGRKSPNPFPGRFYLKRAFELSKRGRVKRVSKAVRRAIKLS